MDNNGDSGGLCGIPAGVGIDCDFVSLNRSCMLLFCRKLSIHFAITVGRCLFFRL